MGIRRQGRETALQLLYLCDNCGFKQSDAAVTVESFDIQKVSKDFALQLFNGVWNKKSTLDKFISDCADNWDLKRMAVIDRNILRLASFEMLDMHETPVNVIIDEAVEIAKRYSTADSSKFVNGVLDRIKVVREGKVCLPK